MHKRASKCIWLLTNSQRKTCTLKWNLLCPDRSTGNRDINSYISIIWIPWKKLNSTPKSVTEGYSKSGILIYNSKVLETADRKQEGEEKEHRQLQNVMHFMQMKILDKKLIYYSFNLPTIVLVIWLVILIKFCCFIIHHSIEVHSVSITTVS